MTPILEQLGEVLRDAALPGVEAAPSRLLASLAQHQDPFRAVLNDELNNEIYAAFWEEYGFVLAARRTGTPLNTEQLEKLTTLLRWLVHSLNAWIPAADATYYTLVAMLLITHCLYPQGDLWRDLPPHIGDNQALRDAFAALLSRFDITYSVRGGGAPPIWEGELVEQFQQADAQQDWKTVLSIWPRLRQPYGENAIVIEIANGLASLDFQRLVRILNSIGKMPNAMQILQALPPAERFRLSLAAENPRIALAAVTLSAERWREKAELGETDRTLLTHILQKVAADEDLWKQWMAIFNYRPSQYPLLQRPLGQALAIISDDAVTVYVDNLFLGTKFNREAVTDCLRTFRVAADRERREYLWRLAHARWSLWNFDAADKHNHLFKCAISTLDYALVGFALECLTDEEREQHMSDLRDKLSTLDTIWHASHSAFTSSWSRLVSAFQPFAHAKTVAASGGDWLMRGMHYFPYDPEANKYLVALSGMQKNQADDF